MSENFFFFFKVMSSDTSGCSDDEDPEEWHEEVADLLEDMANDEPPPELIQHRSSTQTLPILLRGSFTFCYFGKQLARYVVLSCSYDLCSSLCM